MLVCSFPDVLRLHDIYLLLELVGGGGEERGAWGGWVLDSIAGDSKKKIKVDITENSPC